MLPESIASVSCVGRTAVLKGDGKDLFRALSLSSALKALPALSSRDLCLSLLAHLIES